MISATEGASVLRVTVTRAKFIMSAIEYLKIEGLNVCAFDDWAQFMAVSL